jgi:hypothetical protein
MERTQAGQVASGAVVWVVGILLAIALIIWILPHLH